MSAKKKNKKKSNKKNKNYNSKVRQNQNSSKGNNKGNKNNNQNKNKVEQKENKVEEINQNVNAENNQSTPVEQNTIVVENLKETLREVTANANVEAVREVEEETTKDEKVESSEAVETKTEEKVEEKVEQKEPEKKKKLSKEEKEKALIKNVEKKLEKAKTEVTPEYVQKMLKSRKRKKIIAGIICFLVVFMIGFSTLFALNNQNNTNILKGVTVEDIDVSGLSKDEAKRLLEDYITEHIPSELNLEYVEYKTIIKPEQFSYKYDIDATVEKAYEIGRSGTLLENNYKIIATKLFGDKIPFTYTYDEETLVGLIENKNDEIPGRVVQPSFSIDGDKLYVDRGSDGILINTSGLKNKIILALYKYSIGENVNTIEIPVDQVKAEDIDMDKIYSEIYCEPKDAYYETEPYAIYPDTDGIDLAIPVEEAKKQVEATYKDEYVFDLKISKAAKTIRDLGTEAFPYLISSFSTKYDASNINRSTNLEIAAGKINGKVLMPGETFSYNETVGKRTIEEGYKDAKIYANGQVVDGLAGGICQVSSTLYNSALLANLEIVERRNHSFPASYIGVGRDATVVYGVKDLKFKNNRTYPIKIEASVKAGVCQFDIHGLQEEKEYEVKILPVTTGTIPTSVAYQTNPAFAPGQQAVIQSGHAGYRVTTYKELVYNGEVVSKEVISNDTYSPMQTIISVGPAAPVQ